MTTFLLLFGGIFFFVGFVTTAAFAGFSFYIPGAGFDFFLLFPASFMLVGLGVLCYAFRLIGRKKEVKKKGTKYKAKIYGYVEDTSFTLNNAYTVNLKVHYFDRSHIEREAILAANFPKNSDIYGIGMTVDIYEYKGLYDYDKNSVRIERLEGEEELMDNKPIAPQEQSNAAIRCPNCGASFNAVKGYSNKCPYCGGYIDA